MTLTLMHGEAQRFGGNGPGDVPLKASSDKCRTLSLSVCIWKVGIRRKTTNLESELLGGSMWLLLVQMPEGLAQ